MFLSYDLDAAVVFWTLHCFAFNVPVDSVHASSSCQQNMRSFQHDSNHPYRLASVKSVHSPAKWPHLNATDLLFLVLIFAHLGRTPRQTGGWMMTRVVQTRQPTLMSHCWGRPLQGSLLQPMGQPPAALPCMGPPPACPCSSPQPPPALLLEPCLLAASQPTPPCPQSMPMIPLSNPAATLLSPPPAHLLLSWSLRLRPRSCDAALAVSIQGSLGMTPRPPM